MLRTENKLDELIRKARRSRAPAELHLPKGDLVVLVLPRREYERIRGFRALAKVVARRPKRSPQELFRDTQRTLRQYEKKYKMSSAEFYRRFQAAELDETEDFFDWRFEYNSYRRLKKRVANARRQDT